MSLISRILKANPSAQVSSVLTGSFTIPSAKGAFYEPPTPRGLFVGGQPVSNPAVNIDYIEIATTGNAANFGDLTFGAYDCPGVNASTTRAVIGGGQRRVSNVNAYSNIMDYVTIATTGNATDFGDRTVTGGQRGSFSNSTRGVSGDGQYIDYVTIASTGNAVDFGDRTVNADQYCGTGSSTRGLFFGGAVPGAGGGSAYNVIDYFTIANTGNATDFGDLAYGTYVQGCLSSPTRAVVGGANYAGVGYDSGISYVTIASTGNATNFGNLSSARGNGAGTSSDIRGIFSGGEGSNGSNVIDYITIASTGNATDFGDLTQQRRAHAAASNAHGGL